MESTITAALLIVLLTGWHLHNRRHPGWLASNDGRFYVLCGYPLVTVAAYWLVTAPAATTWEWAFGNAWALVAMVAFVLGFDALNRATVQHGERAQDFETVELTNAAISEGDQPPAAAR